MPFDLSILTPDKCFFSGQVQEVIFSTPEGSLGILAGHEPMIAAVSEGVIQILADSAWKTAAVGQGFAETTGNRAEFFLDSVEWADEIDATRAREALERAELRLKNKLSKIEYTRTHAAIARAAARLKAAAFK